MEDLRGETILIVEDIGCFRGIIGNELSLLGFDVFECSNAAEALSLCDNISIDVVLTDLNLPGMNGVKLSHQLKLKNPRIKVILTSAASLPREFEAQACTFIKKSACVTSYIDEIIHAINSSRQVQHLTQH
jgi:DNA-binding NtrC family response regulator